MMYQLKKLGGLVRPFLPCMWHGIICLILICSSARGTVTPSSSRVSIVGSSIITTSGTYSVAFDFSGTVTISADDVILDLNNRKITGGTACVSVTSHSNIKIQNGILASASINDILISSCTNVTVENISFIDSPTAITTNDSTAVYIDGCTFNQTSVGACAIAFSQVFDSMISNCAQFKSTICTSLDIRSSTNIVLTDISLNNNTGTTPVAFAGLSATRGIVLSSCNAVVCQNCMCNSNTDTSGKGYEGFLIISSNNILLSNCLAQRNATTNISVTGFHTSASNYVTYDSCIVESLSGGGSATASGFASDSISAFVLFKNCMATGNTGLTVSGFAISQSDNSVLQSCTSCKNVSQNAGIGYNISSTNNLILQNCDAHGESSTASTYTGIAISLSTAPEVINCNASANTASTTCTGYSFSGSQCMFKNNVAYNNTGSTSVGFNLALNSTPVASIWGNQSQGQGANNFITSGATVSVTTYTTSTGAFSATPTPYSNISVVA